MTKIRNLNVSFNENQIIEIHLRDIRETLARFSNRKILQYIYLEITFESKVQGKRVYIGHYVLSSRVQVRLGFNV